MKIDIDYFYDNLKDLDLKDAKELITFLGNSIFDDPRALMSEYYSSITKLPIPFTYHFISKIVSSPELKNIYFEGLFDKDSEIEDIDLADLLLPIHNELKIRSSILYLSMTREIPDNLVDLYYNQIVNLGDRFFYDTCSRRGDQILLSSKVFKKLSDFCKFRSPDSYYLSMPEYFLDKQEMFDFYIDNIDSKGDSIVSLALRVSNIHEKFNPSEVVSLVKKIKKHSLQKEIVKTLLSKHELDSYSDAEFLDLMEIISHEELLNFINEAELCRENRFLVYNCILKNNKPLSFNEESVDLQSGFYFRYAVQSKNKRFVVELLSFFESKSLASKMQAFLELLYVKDLAMFHFAVDQSKSFLEEHNVFINDKEFNKKLNIEPLSNSEKIQKLDYYDCFDFFKSNKVNLDDFKVFYEKFRDIEDNSIISLIIKGIALSKPIQDFLFNNMGRSLIAENIYFFDLIDDSQFLDFFINNLELIKDKRLNAHQEKLILNIEIPLVESDLFDFLSSMICRSASPELVNKLMLKLENDPQLFKAFLNSKLQSLIAYNLMSEYFFSKYVISNLDDGLISPQTCADILNSEIFSSVPKDKYSKLYSGLKKLPRFLDNPLFSNLTELVENSNDPDFLFNSNNFSDFFYQRCYDFKKYFKSQKAIIGEKIENYSSDSLRYFCNYLDSSDFKKIIPHLSNPQVKEFYPEISLLMSNDDLEIAKNSSIGYGLYFFHKKEVLQYVERIIPSASEDVIHNLKEMFEHISDTRRLGSCSDFSKNLIVLMIEKLNFTSKGFIENVYDSKILSFDELANLTNSQEMSLSVIEAMGNSDLTFTYLNFLRAKDINLIPKHFLRSLDSSIPGQSWDFYIETSYALINFSSDKESDFYTVFFDNLIKSFDNNASTFNCQLLSIFTFPKNIISKILTIDLDANLRKGIDSKNEENILSAFIEQLPNMDLEIVELLDVKNSNKNNAICVSTAISLYKNGVKDIFKYSKFSSSKLVKDSELMEILNDDMNPSLLDFFLKNWKMHTSGYGYVDYNSKVAKELAKTVEVSDMTKDSIEFDSVKIKFKISEIDILTLFLDKKTGKFKFLSGYRKDLSKALKEKFLELEESFPIKIMGTVDVENSKFIPKIEMDYPFIFNAEDDERLTYMKELGFSGKLNAVANRRSNFTYNVEIMFEQKTTISSKSIETAVKAKTFDISKKLKELLKVSPNRKFGFELELIALDATRNDVKKELSKKGFKIKVSNSYHQSTGKTWDFKEDSSLNENYYADDNYDYDDNEDDEDYAKKPRTIDAFEIASPILCGKEGINEASKFLDNLFLKFDIESGEELNAGLHVHHDISDIEKLDVSSSKILESYLPFQETLYSLVDTYRIDNDYCAKISPEDLEEGRNLRSARATGIILTSFGTMEFRMKEGLTSKKDIINWILYTQNVVDLVYIRLTNKISKFQKKIEKMSETSLFMLIDSNSYGMINKARIKNLRKIVGFQEVLYANN